MANEEFYQAAKDAIRACDRPAAVDAATKALAAGVAPDDILKNGFIPGIAAMGDLFERGEVFLPELVLAADAMTGAAEVCNAALPEGEAEAKGTVVIGTVQGDVHDIGKTIVVAFLRANGYEVHDLGRDISGDKFIAKAEEVGAKVIAAAASPHHDHARADPCDRGLECSGPARQIQGHRRRRRLHAAVGREDRRRRLRRGRQRRRAQDQRTDGQLSLIGRG